MTKAGKAILVDLDGETRVEHGVEAIGASNDSYWIRYDPRPGIPTDVMFIPTRLLLAMRFIVTETEEEDAQQV